MKNKISGILISIIILLGFNLNFSNINSGNLTLESTLSETTTNPSSAMSDALKEMLSMGRIALELPAKFKDVKQEISNLTALSKCTEDPKSSKCNKALCKKRKDCLGISMSHIAKLLVPILNTFLGHVTDKTVERGGKQVPIKEFNRGFITSVLTIMPKFIDLFIKALPNNIKDNAQIKQAVGLIESFTKAINNKIMPKMVNITEYLQLSTDMLNGLSFALAPEAAIAGAPKIDLPPIELPADEEGIDEEEFSFEDIDEEENQI